MKINKEVLECLIGMTKEEAFESCRKSGFNFRVIREDSVHNIITMDFREDRIGLEIDKNKVTKCELG